jgi:Dockerin type I domain/PA14 domain
VKRVLLLIVGFSFLAGTALARTQFYAADTNGNVFAVGADRRTDFQIHLSGAPRAFVATREGFAVLAADGFTLRFIDQSGAEIRQREIHGGPYAALSQIGETTYGLAVDPLARRAQIDAVDLATGLSARLFTLDVAEARDFAADDGSFVILAGSDTTQRLLRFDPASHAIQELPKIALSLTHITTGPASEILGSTDTKLLVMINPATGALTALPDRVGDVASLSHDHRVGPESSTVPGDANGDGTVTVGDIFYLVNFLFAGGPPPIGPADVNGDGQVTVGDVFYLINYLFAGGPPPVVGGLQISSLSPSSVFAGSPDTTLTVNGNGFVSGSAVVFNGTALATTFVSGTKLTAIIPAALQSTPGSFSVQVVNPDTTSSNRATLSVLQSTLLGTYYTGTPALDGNGLPVISGPPLFARGDATVQFGTSTGFQWRPCLPDSTLCVGPAFSVRWDGSIYLSQAGIYTFATNSSDASLLQVNGQNVVTNPGVHTATQRTGTFTATSSGIYPFTLTFNSSGATPGIDLFYQPPGATALGAVPSTILWNKGTVSNQWPAALNTVVTFFNPGTMPLPSGATTSLGTAAVSFFNPSPLPGPSGASASADVAPVSFFNPSPLPGPSGASASADVAPVSFFNPSPLPVASGASASADVAPVSFFNPASVAGATGSSSSGTQSISLVNGPAVLSVSPIQLSRSSAASLTISGANLAGATAVAVNPSSGIVVGTPAVSATTVTVLLTMTSSTPTGIVEVTVSGAGWSTPVTALTRFEVIP